MRVPRPAARITATTGRVGAVDDGTPVAVPEGVDGFDAFDGFDGDDGYVMARAP
ncbi:MAG: hypothetical protein KF817_10100 [Phycisphaeraceae bacterium]|nr:hypothetical protein [Phycisphaeraceae bacterium]